MIADGEFLEWAEVFGSNYYGTALAALEHAREAGKDLLLDIDVQGAVQVMAEAAGGGFDLHSCRRVRRCWSGGCAIAARPRV